MNIFDIVPENYFSIFTGKNRAVYAESLLTLYDILENDESLIDKDDFIKALKDKSKALDSFTYEGEDFDATDQDALLLNTLSSKAAFICRRLEETGWIDIAIDPVTFQETIVLPVYSILFLRGMKEIISDEERPYLSLVHSTYSELKLEDEEKDELMYSTLQRCYDNTKKLKVELITLEHSIRIFQNRLGKSFETNEVLHDYFDTYKSKVIDRYYHPLKTFDSVVKFKRPIVKILEGWLKDKEVREKMIAQASIVRGIKGKEEIEKDIIAKINYITDTYETINKLISSIDKEHSGYTKSSANKIIYLNNNDRTIKGHLENIMKNYSLSLKNESKLRKIVSLMQDSCPFYEQGYIASKSLTLPILRRYRAEGEPLEIVNFDEASEIVMQDFLDETRNIYTDEKIYDFMDRAFAGEDVLYSKDLPLVDFDAFICLILATIKKDDDTCFYTIEEVDKSTIKNHDFLIPNFVFKKKENVSR
jgi:hypothetical protein